MKKTTAIFAALALATLSMAGCSAGNEGTDATATNAVADPGEAGFDLSSIEADPQIAAMVPQELKDRGVLENGASTDYAPAEYRKADGQTPTGYGVDMIAAVAKVMGLTAHTTHEDFDGLIAKVGTKFDTGVSSFTITPERLAEYNMISYSKVGFSFGVKKGNPTGFSPSDLCGHTIGAQTGTAQLEYLEQQSAKCESEGKAAIAIMPHKAQTEVTQKVVGGQYDAMVADSPVTGYAVTMTNGELEKAGEAFDTALHGIVVAKDNPDLAKAIEAAVNKLISDGTIQKLYDHYGVSDIFIQKAELNPNTN